MINYLSTISAHRTILLRLGALSFTLLLSISATRIRGLEEYGSFLILIACSQLLAGIIAAHNKDILITICKTLNIKRIPIKPLFKHIVVTIIQISTSVFVMFVLLKSLSIFNLINSEKLMIPLLLYSAIIIVIDFQTGLLVLSGQITNIYLLNIFESLIFLIFIVHTDIEMFLIGFTSQAIVCILMIFISLYVLARDGIDHEGDVTWYSYYQVSRNNYIAGVFKTIVKRIEAPVVALAGSAELVAICKLIQQIFVPLSALPEVLISQSVKNSSKKYFHKIIKIQSKIGKKYFILLSIPTIILSPFYMNFLSIDLDFKILIVFIIFFANSVITQMQWFSRLITYLYSSSYVSKAAIIYSFIYLLSLTLVIVTDVLYAIAFANLVSTSVLYFYWRNILRHVC